MPPRWQRVLVYLLFFLAYFGVPLFLIGGTLFTVLTNR